LRLIIQRWHHQLRTSRIIDLAEDG
jgi:hypothetical protein